MKTKLKNLLLLATPITLLVIVLAQFNRTSQAGQEGSFVYAPLIARPFPTATPTSTPIPTPTLPAVCNSCSQDTLNCSDFSTFDDANACYQHCLAVAGRDVHNLDSDGDGLACESLPAATASPTLTPTPSITPTYAPTPVDDGEPNSTCAQAHSITTNELHRFLANDTHDWYTFDLEISSTILVELKDFRPERGQIVMYRGESCSSLGTVVNSSLTSEGASMRVRNAQAGRYYLLVINDGPFVDYSSYSLFVDSGE